MKFWRPGITGKLFIAILATCIVLLISMHWAVRISFERGFIDYIKRGNEQRLTMLGDALSEQYAQHGSWTFLRNNDRFIFQLLKTFERDNDDRSPPAAVWATVRWMSRTVAPAGRDAAGRRAGPAARRSTRRSWRPRSRPRYASARLAHHVLGGRSKRTRTGGPARTRAEGRYPAQYYGRRR
ncbi:Sensory histidine kinase BaeS [Klebsiella michiganensis]|uniref:Sensory histidine kinase BaeS n=1 Tax=Klebsiella michiganensis TaxID=1134687 RepID=A0A7H4PQ27_9ENTR|nr:Sensory histidine kinase BaeS [Klebsiella michiganensis]